MNAYAVMFTGPDGKDYWKVLFNKRIVKEFLKYNYEGGGVDFKIYVKKVDHRKDIQGWDAPTWAATSEEVNVEDFN